VLAGLHPCSHGSARPGSSRDLTPPPAAQSGGQKVTSPAQIESLQRTLEDVLGPRRQLARSASKRPKVGEGVAAAADQKKALLYNLMGAPSGCMRGGGGRGAHASGGRPRRAAAAAGMPQHQAGRNANTAGQPAVAQDAPGWVWPCCEAAWHGACRPPVHAPSLLTRPRQPHRRSSVLQQHCSLCLELAQGLPFKVQLESQRLRQEPVRGACP